MAKTLRVRTRSGWVTKPAADIPENRLRAEEVDDNFLALQDEKVDKSGDTMTGALTAPQFNGPLAGNATTATNLQTSRNINGTSFNGSSAITTANWGTARTLTIGNTGKSVNGSANVSWTVEEIGAASPGKAIAMAIVFGG